MDMNSTIAWTLCLLLPFGVSASTEQQDPASIQTNEQGCTRIRSIGPQDPYKDPSPLKQACLGPYLLEIPQNYFYNSIGTEHDGSYALALEYPLLEPFKPGERAKWNFDVNARTVTFDFRYIDRINVRQAMRRRYTPMDYAKDEPQERLETRIQGNPVHGLTPYYLDMGLVRTYFRDQGYREEAPVMSPDWHHDWFLAKDENGEVVTFIKCTPREITWSGVEYRDGKVVRKKGPGFAVCSHTLMIPELDTLIEMRYLREGMQHWKRMEERARELIAQFKVNSTGNAKATSATGQSPEL